MFPEPTTRPGPDERSGSGDDSNLVVADCEAHNEDIRAAVPLASDIECALWNAAVLKAANYDNIDGRFPVLQAHVELLSAQPDPMLPSSTVAAEQSLREELLANDSPGG